MLRFLVRVVGFLAIVLWTIAMATLATTMLEGGSILQAFDIATGDPSIDELIADGLLMVQQAGLAGVAAAWGIGLAVILVARGVLLAIAALIDSLLSLGRNRPRQPAPVPKPVALPEPPPGAPGPWSREAPGPRRDVEPPAGLARPTRPAKTPALPKAPALPKTPLPTVTRTPVVERPLRLARLIGADGAVVIQRPRGHLVQR